MPDEWMTGGVDCPPVVGKAIPVSGTSERAHLESSKILEILESVLEELKTLKAQVGRHEVLIQHEEVLRVEKTRKSRSKIRRGVLHVGDRVIPKSGVGWRPETGTIAKIDSRSGRVLVNFPATGKAHWYNPDSLDWWQKRA